MSASATQGGHKKKKKKERRKKQDENIMVCPITQGDHNNSHNNYNNNNLYIIRTKSLCGQGMAGQTGVGSAPNKPCRYRTARGPGVVFEICRSVHNPLPAE